jgi:UDP-2-acetamido-2-deoxy-ribo-hexuluronate aminotransferase
MKHIPMLDLKLEYEYMKADIDAAIRRCLAHQKWIFGPEIKELEGSIASYLKVEHCIGVSSGTEALVLSLRALAIKSKGKQFFDNGDEIITSPFTFTATGDAVLRSGATPVFVDIDQESYNLDIDQVEEYLETYGVRVKGIIPVHLYGQSCCMDRITELAARHGLFVVEDVAQAFGAEWNGRKLGSIGTTGCFSFFPSKNLGGFGDGGMISTDDDEIAELVRMLLKHGGKDKYNVDYIGYNARLDTLQAAIILAKLRYVDEFNDLRRQIAQRYDEGLRGIRAVTAPIINPVPEVHHVYHQYTVRTERREAIQAHLKDNGIATMVYYPFPLHKMKVFEGRMKTFGDLRNAEKAAREVFSLPIEPLQKQADTDFVIEAFQNLNTEVRELEERRSN